MAGKNKQVGSKQVPKPLIVVPDCNALVHGKWLTDMPWHELGCDPIEVVLIAPVIRELDQLKNKPTRPGRIARDVTERVRAIAKAPGKQVELSMHKPRVAVKMMTSGLPSSALLQGLDLAHMDQAIINVCLSIAETGNDVLFLTDDTIASVTAEEFGLTARLIDHQWLRPTEPDAASKELAKLRAENAKLKSHEPRFDLKFCGPDGTPVKRLNAVLKRWDPLSDIQIDALVEEVSRACPMQTEFAPATKPERKPKPGSAVSELGEAISRLSSIGMTFNFFEPPSADEIEEYQGRAYPGWLMALRKRFANLHLDMTARTEWPKAQLTAANVGTRPADNALVELRIGGPMDLANDEQSEEDEKPRPALDLPLPPRAPRGKNRFVGDAALALAESMKFGDPLRTDIIRALPSFPKPRDPDAFYWKTGKRQPGPKLALECASWRHKRDPEVFPFRIMGELEGSSARGAVTAHISAANLSEPVSAQLPVEFKVVAGDTHKVAENLVADLLVRVRHR